ncbi:MAG: BA14K family protein [Sphingobium sp.]
MNKIFAALAATIMLSGTASAQNHAPANHAPTNHATQPQQQGGQHHDAPQHKAVTPAKQNSHAQSPAHYPAPPKHWSKRTTHEWQAHVDRCEKKYRSYNPKTDRYTIRKGQTALCRL